VDRESSEARVERVRPGFGDALRRHRPGDRTHGSVRTGERPARRDMLLVIPPWTACFGRGIRACDEHLRELERRHPNIVPEQADERAG